MTHRDGFPRFSARSAWRSDAGHRKPCATPSESLGKPPPVAQANRRRASENLADVPHRVRLSSYPADRLRDLYGLLSTLLGITTGQGRRIFARRCRLPGGSGRSEMFWKCANYRYNARHGQDGAERQERIDRIDRARGRRTLRRVKP